MEDHHNSFLQTVVGFFGMIIGLFMKYEAVIHSAATSISLYGGTVLVIGGLINYFTGWTFLGWLRKKLKKGKHK